MQRCVVLTPSPISTRKRPKVNQRLCVIEQEAKRVFSGLWFRPEAVIHGRALIDTLEILEEFLKSRDAQWPHYFPANTKYSGCVSCKALSIFCSGVFPKQGYSVSEDYRLFGDPTFYLNSYHQVALCPNHMHDLVIQHNELEKLFRKRMEAKKQNEQLNFSTQFSESIPSEVLHHIFSFLLVPDLVAVSSVCRHWRRAARGEELWRTATMKTFSIGQQDIIESSEPVAIRSCLPLFISHLMQKLHIVVPLPDSNISKEQTLIAVQRACAECYRLSLEPSTFQHDLTTRRWLEHNVFNPSDIFIPPGFHSWREWGMYLHWCAVLQTDNIGGCDIQLFMVIDGYLCSCSRKWYEDLQANKQHIARCFYEDNTIIKLTTQSKLVLLGEYDPGCDFGGYFARNAKRGWEVLKMYPYK